MMRTLLPLLGMLPATLAQTSGTFNAMTFNVAGLPAILNGNEVPGDKTANTARIGQLFTQYDIDLINVQEDFNFHATLYANDNHPQRTPTSGGVPFGSGLNTLSNFEYEEFERVKWNVCSNTDSADCLTPKGFTFMRVKVAPGVFLDAYNLHADAGGSDADNVARAANIKQVSDFIKVRSIGNPVLVFGDSNTRYTRAVDNPWLFAQENGMKDSWVELIRGGNAPAGGSDALLCDNPSRVNTCETVDKFWYRGSSAVKLQATGWKYASTMFLQENGDILSDHNPVLVDFSWTAGELLRVSDTWGGPHGDWYNDLDTVSSINSPAASSITLRGADRLDAVQITLASGQTFTHGGSGGSASTLRLNAGERITGGTLCSAQKSGRTRIFFAELRTSAGRSLAKGVRTDSCVERNAPEGFGVVGFLGRAGDEVDQLGFVFGKA